MSVTGPNGGDSDDARSTLASSLEALGRGQGGVVLVEGAPGLGKTHAVRQLLSRACAEGVVVLHTQAQPMDCACAWSILLALVGEHLRAVGSAERARLVAGLRDLGRLLPELELTAEPLGDAALEKARLLAALGAVVRRIAAEHPVLMAIDDLHEVDDASLEWLHQVARLTASLPLLLVTTVRSPRDPRPMLDVLVRSLPAARVALAPLDRDGVCAIGLAVLGGPLEPAFADVLLSRSGGVPLFVRSLLEHLAAQGALLSAGPLWTAAGDALDSVPPDVQALFAERAGRLDPEARAVLELVACAGTWVSHDDLEALSGQSEPGLGAEITRLCEAGWLEIEESSRAIAYRLRHPLARDALHDAMPPAHRRSLHSRWADLLEQRSHDPARLGEHYRLAGTTAAGGRAIPALTAAAEALLARSAPREAARYLDAALVHCDDPAQASALLERLGQAHRLAGRLADAESAFAGALRDAEGARIGSLRRALARLAWERGDAEHAEQHVAAGLASLAHRPAAERLEVLRAQALMLDRSLRARELLELMPEMERAAEAADCPAARVDLLTFQGSLAIYRGDEASVDAMSEQIGEMRGGVDPLTRLSLERTEILAHRSLGRHRQAMALADALLASTAGLGSPQLLYEASIARLTALEAAGGFDEIEELAAGLERSAAEGARTPATLLIVRAGVRSRRGQLEAAWRDLEAARAYAPGFDARFRWFLGFVEATLRHREGRHEEAADALEALAPIDGPMVIAPQPTTALLLAAEARLSAGDLERVERLAVVLGRRDTSARLAADYLRARLMLARGAAAKAAVAARRARDGFYARGAILEGAAAELALAQALAARGARARGDAIATASAAHACLARLQLGPECQIARTLLRELGAPPPRRPARNDPAAPDDARTSSRRVSSGDALSARELDVALQVARGLTNKEVARALFVSTSTVDTHLKRIYRRLGISSRAALASWVAQRDEGVSDRPQARHRSA